MFFRKSKKEVGKSVSKIDKIVTGMIVWGAAASIFGLSRTKKWKNISAKVFSLWEKWAKQGYSFFGKIVARTVDFFTKK